MSDIRTERRLMVVVRTTLLTSLSIALDDNDMDDGDEEEEEEDEDVDEVEWRSLSNTAFILGSTYSVLSYLMITSVSGSPVMHK